MVRTHGRCPGRLSGVRESLEADDVGASVAVYLDGEPVVDLWGGYADAARTTLWQRDSILNTWSTTSEPMTRYRQLQDGDAGRYGRLADTLISQGVWVARRGIWYVSAAHPAADVSETVDRIESAFQIFTAAGPAS